MIAGIIGALLRSVSGAWLLDLIKALAGPLAGLFTARADTQARLGEAGAAAAPAERQAVAGERQALFGNPWYVALTFLIFGPAIAYQWAIFLDSAFQFAGWSIGAPAAIQALWSNQLLAFSGGVAGGIAGGITGWAIAKAVTR